MAKSIRSKVKKRNRTIMRKTVGKEFNDKILAKTESIRLKNLAVRYAATTPV